MEHNKVVAPVWAKAILFVAFVYGVVWGALSMLFPSVVFSLNHINLPNQFFMWQVVGMVELVLGIGYLVAYTDIYRYWPIVLMGLLVNVLSLGLFWVNAYHDERLWAIGNFVLLNNAVWLLPFAAVLYRVYRHSFSSDDLLIRMFSSDTYTLDMFDTSLGIDLQELSHNAPVMLIFLRHFGCTFCRETLADMALQRSEIENMGTTIVFVHMLEDEDAAHAELAKFGLKDMVTISDPESILYKKFGLRKGTLTQLYGLKIWTRGIVAGWVKGLGIGKPMGDPNQMPGVFLLYRGEVRKSYIHHSAADRPQYMQLATCDDCNVSM